MHMISTTELRKSVASDRRRSKGRDGRGGGVELSYTGHRNNAEDINRQSLHTLASCSNERNNTPVGTWEDNDDGGK